jgi:voltage-gated potassium channel
VRFWCCVERPKYAKHGAIFGRIRFIISIASIIDMIAFIPYWIGFIVVWTQTGSPFIDGISFLAAIRIFRVFHLFKVKKYTHAVAIFTEILRNNKEILITVLMYETTLFLVTSTALYYAERRPPPLQNTFASIPDAMYTSVLVLTGHTVPSKECSSLSRLFLLVILVHRTSDIDVSC